MFHFEFIPHVLDELGGDDGVRVVLNEAQNEHAIVAHVVLAEQLHQELVFFAQIRIERAYVMEQKLETIVRAEEDDSFEPGEQVEDRERYDNDKDPEPEEGVDALVE